MVECYTPKSLDEALAIRRRTGARPLAGGTDLMVQYKQGVGITPVFPFPVMIISGIEELKGIETCEDGSVLIKALTTPSQIASCEAVPYLVRAAAGRMGAVALRMSRDAVDALIDGRRVLVPAVEEFIAHIDFDNTLCTTRSALEAVRANGIPRIFFSSTSAVYGDKKGKRLTEDEGDLRPISYYGASKLASEALISAYSYMCGFDALIFRFPNVVGPRLTHGVIFDFIEKLERDPSRLVILGDGRQNKQYVYSQDLVQGICDFMSRGYEGYNIFNISTESFTDVNTIADIVCRGMGLDDVKYEYTGGSCGWKGDVPSFDYDISKAKSEGWSFRYNSTQAVEATVTAVLSTR